MGRPRLHEMNAHPFKNHSLKKGKEKLHALEGLPNLVYSGYIIIKQTIHFYEGNPLDQPS